MSILDTAIERIQNQWHEVMEVKATLVSVVIVTAFTVWLVTSYAYSREIAGLTASANASDQRRQLAEDKVSNNKTGPEPLVTPENLVSGNELREKHLRGKSFRLTDVLAASGSLNLDGRTFEACDIYGPAVVGLGGPLRFSKNTINGPSDGTFIRIQPGTKYVGFIPARGAEFIGCKFYGIAFALIEEKYELLKKSMGLNQ